MWRVLLLRFSLTPKPRSPGTHYVAYVLEQSPSLCLLTAGVTPHSARKVGFVVVSFQTRSYSIGKVGLKCAGMLLS